MNQPRNEQHLTHRASVPVRVGFTAVLLAYLTLATAQSYATRLQWGPDEPAHIIYVRSLASDGRLPALAHSVDENTYVPGASRSHQAQHPPLYYALAAGVWRAFDGRTDDVVRYADPVTGQPTSLLVPGPVRPVRMLSVVLGLITLGLTWGTARLVFPARPSLWLAAVACTAFTPMFTYMHGVVNNDALLVLVFVAVAWRWALVMRFGSTPKDALLLALFLGLGLNVKETALALLPLTGIVLALDRTAGPFTRRLRRAGAVLAVAVAVGGWWYVRKYLLYGTPFVYPFHSPLLALPASQKAVLLKALPARIFIFAFVPVDAVAGHFVLEPVLFGFVALALACLVGTTMLFLHRRQVRPPSYESASILLWLMTSSLVLAGLWWNLLTVDWRMGTSGGRLLLCVLPLLWLTGVRGLSALLRDGRAASVALATLAVLLFALNVHIISATAAAYGTLGS